MRKYNALSVILLFFLGTILFSCAPTITSKVLKPAEIDLHGYTRVAVLNFDGTGGREVRDWLESAVSNARLEGKSYFKVVNRSQIQKILGEQAFGGTGAIDAGTAAKMGKILGVEAVITGSVNGFETSESTGIVQRREPIARTKPRRYRYFNVRVADRKAYVSFTVNFIDSSTAEVMAGESLDGEETSHAEGSGAVTKLEPKAKLLKLAANKVINVFIRKISPHYVDQKVDLKDRSDESSIMSFRAPPEQKALDKCIKRGGMFAKASQWDKSIQEWEKCLKIKSDSAAVYYNLGVAYESKGNLNKAIENYQKAQELKADELYIMAKSRMDVRLKEQEKLQVQLRKPVIRGGSSQSIATPPPRASKTPEEVKHETRVAAAPAANELLVVKTANIREEATTKSKIIANVKKGATIQKIGKSGNWFNVKLASGKIGWIYKTLVTSID